MQGFWFIVPCPFIKKKTTHRTKEKSMFFKVAAIMADSATCKEG